MTSVERLLSGVPVPKMVAVRQGLARPRLDDVADGIGLADFTTDRVYRKLRFEQMYPAPTTTVPITVKIPMVLGHDRLAIQAAIKTSGAPDKHRVRLVRMENTKTLDAIQVSAAPGEDVDRDPRLEREEQPFALAFDEHGDLR